MPKPFRVNRERLEALKVSDPAKYEEMKGVLAELDRIREENPLQFFEPHAKQAEFFGAGTQVKAFLGGNQSGKTTAGVADDLIQAVDVECLPDSLKGFKRFDPPFLGRIITPDFTSTMEGVVFEKLKALAPQHQLLGGSWEKAYDKQNRKLRFANGSWIDFLTYEQDLDKFGGATLDRVHMDEEPPGEKGRKIYLQAWMRRMARGGDILITQTPELGMSWVYDEIYERRDDPDVTVVQVSTDDNPHIPRDQLEASFARMSEEEQQAKRKGLFVHFSGPVLKGWRDEVHLVDPVSPAHLEGQTVIVGIDPGVVRGAVVWCAFDGDDAMLVFDELYPQDQDVEAVVAQVGERNRFWGVEPDHYVIDPSGRNRTMAGTVIDDFFSHGIYPVLGQNDRRAGILQLRRRLGANPPALLVARNCANWLWERKRWRVARDEEDDRPKPGDTGDTFATTGPDHLMDATRYVAMERFWGPPETVEGRPARPVWVPGTAPPQDWFTVPAEAAPMGSMS